MQVGEKRNGSRWASGCFVKQMAGPARVSARGHERQKSRAGWEGGGGVEEGLWAGGGGGHWGMVHVVPTQEIERLAT